MAATAVAPHLECDSRGHPIVPHGEGIRASQGFSTRASAKRLPVLLSQVVLLEETFQL
ncbi:hypothetical protein [Roseivivax marinus]|uniref:hypothetical protein n=1 Tax=Roseivivax marinus TaxID=1379903 RepID=UPI0012FF033A|nr:hypothetical protein [Roseivivax marinus]